MSKEVNVIKRNGEEVEFDKKKIINAIAKANSSVDKVHQLNRYQIRAIADNIESQVRSYSHAVNVEDIQNMVEIGIMERRGYEVAQKYVRYRYKRELSRKSNTTDDNILTLINQSNENIKQENSNKNPVINSTQRDYMAGEVSKDLTNRVLLPDDIVSAHQEGIIHFHDADYFAQKEHNCDLINLEDMLQNGTVISQTMIEKPHSFYTAANITTQIVAQVASNQYGGQSFTLAHLAPFVDVSRKKIRQQVIEEMKSVCDEIEEKKVHKIAEIRLKDEIKRGVQTIQYQIITLMTCNGQAPFVTMFMYLDEVPEGQIRDDLSMIVEEVLKQRIRGVKNEKGVWITPAFPKLIYVLDEDNIHEDSKYYYLTELAAECTAKRMVPDYISAKIMKELKSDVYTCMGAARGEETVSIRVKDKQYDNIQIRQAFQIIRDSIRSSQQKGYHVPDEFVNTCGVYKITHIPSGLYYIGSSTNIGRRILEHRYCCNHQGTLGDEYYIGDFNSENLEFELLEKCDIDDLYRIESKYVHFKTKDFNCVNQKDPINNGNFDSATRTLALNHQKYSTFENKWKGTWVKAVPDLSSIYIKSNHEWVPIRNIIYNNEKCPLDQYAVTCINTEGDYHTLHVTEDHPFETQKGRVYTSDLTVDDKLIDCNTNEYLDIVDIKKISSNVETYDFTTDNDMFDMSGVISHNCRSFLTPDNEQNDEGLCNTGNKSNAKNYVEGQHKYYGRFNQGVVTVNLVDIACSAVKESKETGKDRFEIFWRIFEERMDLCHRALQCKHNRLMGTPSDVAPILWQYGALARLEKEEPIDKLLFGNYSTISLGFAGLYEMCVEMTGKSHTDPDAKPFALQVMHSLNDHCSKWRKEENISYSLYGTPLESTTYKFAKCLQKRFGKIKNVTDHNYITNSYHVNVREKIDAFTKLQFESEFQALSPGGAISYVEVPDMNSNIPAVLSVMKFIYEHIMYAELNTKSDYCMKCGYDGEIQIVEDKHGKLIWKCPNCGNTDQRFMSVARRTCGYIGTQFWNQGRTQEIKDRVLHL